MTDKAILIGEKVVPCDDLYRWGAFMQNSRNRFICATTLSKRRKIWVSTVFLGLNHSFSEIFGRDDDGGIWFETMIFGTSINGYQVRYRTIEEARRGHAIAVGRARQARQLPAESRKTHRRKMKSFRKYLDDYRSVP